MMADTPDIEARADATLQAFIRPEHLGDPACLIVGERIHWIQKNGFDSGLARVPETVIQNGEQEALGLS
jgi:hypothetical protein